MPTTVPIEESELAALRADRNRLNWLEKCRVALNAHCQSSYGWEVIRSHNVNRIMVRSPFHGEIAAVDVNDAAVGGRDVRAAIDAAMVAAGDPAAAATAVRGIGAS